MLLYLFVVFFCFGMYFHYVNERFKLLDSKIKDLTIKLDSIDKLLNDDLK